MNLKIYVAAFALLVFALLGQSDAVAQSITIDTGAGEGSSMTGRIVQGVVLIGILSIAPGIVIMCTSFTRIIVVLSLLRNGLGLQSAPPNMVLTSLAMFLTFFIMQPHLQQAWDQGLRPLIDDEISEEAAFEKMITPFKTFMEANTREKDIELFASLAAGNTKVFEDNVKGKTPSSTITEASDKATEAAVEAPPLRVLIPAFMISELKRAFEIGFLIMIPFLVIDLIISCILMAMGMMMLPPVMISLPFKIVFFVLIDGWYLIAGSLARSYA